MIPLLVSTRYKISFIFILQLFDCILPHQRGHSRFLLHTATARSDTWNTYVSATNEETAMLVAADAH